MEEKPVTFDRTVRLLITVAVLVGLFLITRQLSGVLLPFLVSWFLAYLIHPVVTFFQYRLRLKNRMLSVMVTLVLLLALITGIIALLVKPVTQEVTKMTAVVSTYLSGIDADTILPAAWQEGIREWLRNVDVISFLKEGNFASLVEKVAPYIGGLLGSGLNMVMGLFVMFVCFLYLVFILIDYERISTGVVQIVPQKYRGLVTDILKDLETGMNKYFRGQALVATCVGVLFAIGLSIVRLPLAIIVGLFIGLLNMVPYMQALGIPVCMLLGLLQSAATGTGYGIILLEIAVVFLVVQVIQDMLLNPLIMGSAIGMKPAVMLLALSVWGSLLGVAGMIIALPLTTVIISYYKRLVLHEDERREVDVSVVDKNDGKI